MGGTLDVESEVDHGANFFFTLKFKKSEEEEENYAGKYKGLKVGMSLPSADVYRQVDVNMIAYFEYLGVDFRIYYGDEPFSVDSSELPDVLFFAQKYNRSSEELERFYTLPSKLVLLTTGDMQRDFKVPTHKVKKIVYKPINLTKIIAVLDMCSKEETIETEVISEGPDYRIFSGIHALVAEDNVINQKLISRVLQGFGLEITVANNGKEAFDLRMQNEYDVIFMDIQMPVMGGIEATKEIIHFENLNRKKHIPIIALTANALQGDREKYLEAGMDNYASKPIDLERLNDILQEYFPKHVKNATQTLKDNAEMKISSDIEVHDDAKSNNEKDRIVKADKTEGNMSDTATRKAVNDSVEKNMPIKKDKQSEKIIELKEQKDILLYHPFSLTASLHERALQNLGYSIDKVTQEEAFMDRMEDTQYRYVIFDGTPFMNMKCLISDMIQSNGAKPFVILSSDQKNIDFCCEVIEEGMHIDIIKMKLEEDQ